MRKKNLSDNQQTLIGDFLPEILVNSKKLDSSMKLILANIYKQHHIHPGLRTVFRTNISFLKDIEGKQQNDLLRPMNRLVTNGYISRTKPSQVNGTACEYSLTDKYYELLPEHLRVSKVTPDDSKVTSKVTPVTLEAKIDAMSLEINELKRQINELREQLDRVSKVTVTNSKVTTINNEQCGSRENKLLKRIVNNNLEPYGSRTGKDEELSLNFSSSEDFSYLDGTGLTAENVERLRYWEKIIDDFSHKKFIPVEKCGICVIDNEDLYRMKEYILSEIEKDKAARPYRKHLEHQLNEVYKKMAA